MSSVREAAGSMLLGVSEYVRRLREQFLLLAQLPWPVVILGETGTGKTLVAWVLHCLAGLPPDRFKRFTPGMMPDGLVEGVMFGNVRGAWTGADRDRTGMIARAQGGTLFVDELQDFTEKVERALLDVLDGLLIVPVGGGVGFLPSVRVVAASKSSLAELVLKGFRPDLRYRLETSEIAVIRLLPLKEQREDIPALAAEMLARAARECKREAPCLSRPALAALMRYDWPGNVRQLGSRLRGALMSAAWAGSLVIEVEHLGLDGNGSNSGARKWRRASDDEIKAALEKANGCQKEAAKLLDVDVRTVQRRLKVMGTG